MSAEVQNSQKMKKTVFKKAWLWIVLIIVIIAVGASASKGEKQANETTKDTDGNSSQSTDIADARLTLDDGWAIDTSNPYATFVEGYVSNNTDRAITTYSQITFTALNDEGANVGSCMANTNDIDANGKWKFRAICTGDDVKTVRFKDITGF